MRLEVILLISSALATAAPPACTPAPEAKAALQAWTESSTNRNLAERRASLDQLAAQFPTDYRIQNFRLRHYRSSLPEAWPALRDSYVKAAEANSADPLALTLAATALVRFNTPRAIELLDRARQMDAQFPWAALKLAELYQTGKFEDKAKSRQNAEVFVGICGAGSPSVLGQTVMKALDKPAQAAIAQARSAALDADPAPEPSAYSELWALEFRLRPPAEHPELRKQVAKDMERLLAGKLNPRDADTLLSGFKQSGASADAITAFEDRIIREAPTSGDAFEIVSERWVKQHPEPKDHKDKTAWEAYEKLALAEKKQWAVRFTEVTWLADQAADLDGRIKSGELQEKEAVALIEERLQQDVTKYGPSFSMYMNAADRVGRQNWAAARAFEWMTTSWTLFEETRRRNLEDDTLTDVQRRDIYPDASYRTYVATAYLRAAWRAGRKEVPAALRELVEGPLPEKKTEIPGRYRAMAWLAQVDGRPADALAWFQQALFLRSGPPQYRRGKFEDQMLDEARAAFLKTGGGERAFAVWSQPPGSAPKLAEGYWVKPVKALPDFELSDITGRKWTLKQLQGKAVLINLWATWCGPCRAEQPHLQKLYEMTKDRSDMAVISFNIDEDLGLVEPYLKEKGYTYPALVARDLVRDVLNSIAIPQNWLVTADGRWIATQIGFDSADTNWENSMLKRLEAAKLGKAPAGAE
jgi:thiol-disulfide isomerase/thioredoxin